MNNKPNSGSFKPGHKGGGRPKKTDDERVAYDYLVKRTPAAAKRLVELVDSEDEKIALGATLGHLKIVVGDLSRVSDKDGKNLASEFAGLTAEEIIRIIGEIKRARGP